jgi:hypothetical protein
VRLRRRVNHCVGFDFHPHFRADEGDHLHHRAGRADVAEYLAVCSTDRPSIIDVDDVNDRPHHVLHTRSGLLKCAADRAENVLGLHIGIARQRLAPRGGTGLCTCAPTRTARLYP